MFEDPPSSSARDETILPTIRSVMTRFVGPSCRSAARTSQRGSRFEARLLRRRSETKSVSPLLLSTAERDPRVPCVQTSDAGGQFDLQRFASPYLVLGPDWTAQRDDDQDQRQNGTGGHHGPLPFGLD